MTGQDPAPASRAKTASRLWREFARPHAWGFAGALGAMALVSAAVVAQNYVLKQVMDGVFIARDPMALRLVSIMVLVILLVRAGAGYVSETILASIGQNIIAATQNRLFAHLIRQDVAQVLDSRTGKMVSHLTFDVSVMRDVVSNAIVTIGRDALQVIGLTAFLFWTDWRLALISLVFAPIALYPVQIIARRMRRVANSVQGEMAGLTGQLTQSFQSLRMIKAYALESRETARIGERIASLTQLNIRAMRIAAASQPLIDTVGALATTGVLFYIGNAVIEGQATPGDFVAFMAAVASAFQPLRTLSRVVPTIAQGLSAADRIFTVLDEAPVLTDAADAKPLPREAGAVRFENVSFGYETETLALDRASFVAPAGKVTALVGPSGAGKSTVFALIPRFYDVRSGSVLVNECDVRTVKAADLRDAIGIVAQDAVLFDDTIAENIRIGRPGASLDDIRKAARAAAADDFIMEFPLGYDTPIGEQGAKLSGGQRQRLSIARAILKDAPILLLDEATSALDSESERQIQSALSALTHGRTTLVIAHRLSTIRNADVIHVFDQGRIIESGTHDALIGKAGLYARLHALQFPDPA